MQSTWQSDGLFIWIISSDFWNKVSWIDCWTPSGLVDGQGLDLSKLSADDYAWYTKNADGTYTEMAGLPTNAGPYYLKLKDSSIAKIQAACVLNHATCGIKAVVRIILL